MRVADGLLLMRRFAGASNLSLTGGMAFGSCATRTTGAAIAAFADPQTLATSSLPALDIDGDGKVLATTDGLLLVRALLVSLATLSSAAHSLRRRPAARGRLSGVTQRAVRSCTVAVTKRPRRDGAASLASTSRKMRRQPSPIMALGQKLLPSIQE